jgi:phospholipid/cholesterol/gamma-HCH transport system substrate-binding protein
MSAPTNQWKLGAFVAGSVLIGLTAAALLTAQTMHVVSVSYTSYFDEAVTGLEMGSPIRFRGVKIGNVSAIDVAPDRRHVEVTYSLGVKVLARLGLAGATEGKETKISVPPDLRVQLASTGLTGTKFLQIDFFDTQGLPPPTLPFPVPENYIPAIPSTMKNLEDAIVRAVDQLPEITRQLSGVISRVNLILDDVNARGLPAKAVATLDGTAHLLASVQSKLDQLPVAELSREASATLSGAGVAMAKLNRALDRLDGEAGLLASAQRTTDSLGDLAGPRLQASIVDTARDVREAAVAMRQLVEALQRDPDMLLKGKAKVSP